jgi:hypothetical protein
VFLLALTVLSFALNNIAKYSMKLPKVHRYYLKTKLPYNAVIAQGHLKDMVFSVMNEN